MQRYEITLGVPKYQRLTYSLIHIVQSFFFFIIQNFNTYHRLFHRRRFTTLLSCSVISFRI
nr:MAG TPA: hypothetical protein [Caudoviricetes sp.]DAG60966.1 MAG TPA: hypothetical protein [Caudoviricetes sp.]